MISLDLSFFFTDNNFKILSVMSDTPLPQTFPMYTHWVNPFCSFSLLLRVIVPGLWDTSSPATVATSTCWRRANSSISMSSEPVPPRCSPSGASVTCSGTHTGATSCPPNEVQRGRGREGWEERRRVGAEMWAEEGGWGKRGGGKGCDHRSSVSKSPVGLRAGWRELDCYI